MENSFVIPEIIKLLIQFFIGIVMLWIVAKIFAFFIPGGGASFAVNYYGKYTFLPSAVLILILDFIVLFKSYDKKVLIIATLVIMSAFTIRLSFPYIDKLSGEEKWNEHCIKAIDEYDLMNENIARIEFFNFVSQEQYTMDKNGEFRRKRGGREYFGLELLKRGIIDEYEVLARGNPAQYISRLVNSEEIKTPTDNSTATHRISYKHKKIANGRKKWFKQYVISITNKETGKVVAKRVQFVDLFNRDRSCAQIYNGRISTTDFIEKSIKSSRE